MLRMALYPLCPATTKEGRTLCVQGAARLACVPGADCPLG
jgi:hypothetical protein